MSAAATLRGAIVWAIAPYAPKAPFRIWGGVDAPIATVETATELARLVRRRGLDAEQTFLTTGKLRPLVILQERPRHALPEHVALRIIRLEELARSHQEAIRSEREPSLFYLRADKAKYGMTKEGAIDLNAVVRIHESAIAGRTIGRLDASELRVIGERLAEHLDLDLTLLIERKARDMFERIAAIRERPDE